MRATNAERLAENLNQFPNIGIFLQQLGRKSREVSLHFDYRMPVWVGRYWDEVFASVDLRTIAFRGVRRKLATSQIEDTLCEVEVVSRLQQMWPNIESEPQQYPVFPDAHVDGRFLVEVYNPGLDGALRGKLPRTPAAALDIATLSRRVQAKIKQKKMLDTPLPLVLFINANGTTFEVEEASETWNSPLTTAISAIVLYRRPSMLNPHLTAEWIPNLRATLPVAAQDSAAILGLFQEFYGDESGARTNGLPPLGT